MKEKEKGVCCQQILWCGVDFKIKLSSSHPPTVSHFASAPPPPPGSGNSTKKPPKFLFYSSNSFRCERDVTTRSSRDNFFPAKQFCKLRKKNKTKQQNKKSELNCVRMDGWMDRKWWGYRPVIDWLMLLLLDLALIVGRHAFDVRADGAGSPTGRTATPQKPAPFGQHPAQQVERLLQKIDSILLHPSQFFFHQRHFVIFQSFNSVFFFFKTDWRVRIGDWLHHHRRFHVHRAGSGCPSTNDHWSGQSTSILRRLPVEQLR